MRPHRSSLTTKRRALGNNTWGKLPQQAELSPGVIPRFAVLPVARWRRRLNIVTMYEYQILGGVIPPADAVGYDEAESALQAEVLHGAEFDGIVVDRPGLATVIRG
jgi:hypothetical protein